MNLEENFFQYFQEDEENTTFPELPVPTTSTPFDDFTLHPVEQHRETLEETTQNGFRPWKWKSPLSPIPKRKNAGDPLRNGGYKRKITKSNYHEKSSVRNQLQHILANLGPECPFFLKSMIHCNVVQDPDQVLVDVGTGYFIEKNMPQAKDYCDRKINLLKSNFEQLVEWTRETKFWAAGRGHIALLLPNFDVVDNILYMAGAIVFAGSMRKSTWIVFLPLCSCFCSLILVRCSVFIQVLDWLFWLRCLWLDIWTEIANHSLLL